MTVFESDLMPNTIVGLLFLLLLLYSLNTHYYFYVHVRYMSS